MVRVGFGHNHPLVGNAKAKQGSLIFQFPTSGMDWTRVLRALYLAPFLRYSRARKDMAALHKVVLRPLGIVPVHRSLLLRVGASIPEVERSVQASIDKEPGRTNACKSDG